MHAATSLACVCSVLEQPMCKKRDPFTHDPVTLRALADEADGHRHRTAFARFDDATLIRALAAAVRAYADARGRDVAPTHSDSRDEQIAVA
jgi:hypothetical protein